MFTSLTLLSSVLDSLLVFLFSKRWTRKGEGTPPTLCATALCLLALRQTSLSPPHSCAILPKPLRQGFNNAIIDRSTI
jgi:hypothetical protein